MILDVGCLADEVRRGVERWIQVLEANPAGTEAMNTEKHLSSLVQARHFPSRDQPGSFPPARQSRSPDQADREAGSGNARQPPAVPPRLVAEIMGKDAFTPKVIEMATARTTERP